MPATEPCPGCAAEFELTPAGATHAYIGASPGCWAAYGRLLARGYGDAGRVHNMRQAVDAYAAQHPGVPGPRQQQSVALHLIALCQWSERGYSPERLQAATRRLAEARRAWPWLTPPALYDRTIHDVLTTDSAEAAEQAVGGWVEAVWRAWSAHHELIRRWADEAG